MSTELSIGFVSILDATDVNQWSGIPAQVLAGFRRLGVRVELYSPLSQKNKYLLAPAKLLSRIKKESISLDHYSVVLQSYADQISSLLRERPVDIIFAPSSIPITLLKCSQPIVFWTDAVFHGMVDFYSGAFAGMPVAAVERGKHQEETALKNCTAALYSSEWAANSARKLTDPAKIHVVPFGASFTIEHTAANVQEWAGQKRLTRPGTCELLFIGVDWERKGGAIAVETAGILNKAGIATRLTVVGCQPPDPLPDYVRVLGFISKATAEGMSQLHNLLRQADFFILPTMAEAAGIVFCEASAFGLPSLAYATGGAPEYVRDGVNGVCLPLGTPASGFATAIQAILEDPARYEALSLRAFEEYQNRLNWDNSIRTLVNICQQALTARNL